MHSVIAFVFVAIVLISATIMVGYAGQATATEYALSENGTSGAINTTVYFPNSTIDNVFYSDSATVVNATSDTELTSGQDYEWNTINGTVTVLSQEASNTTLTANYTLYEGSDTQKGVLDTVTKTYSVAAYVPLILLIGLLGIVLSLFGGLA